MELDDFKSTWRSMNHAAGPGATDDAELLRRLRRERVRGGVALAQGWPLFDLLAGLLATWLLVAFIERVGWQLRFLVPALQLYVAALAGIVASAWQLARLRGLDYAAPTLHLQRELARLRLVRTRVTQAVLLLAPLLWVPLSIVLARAVGVDLYRAFGAPWLAANAALGLAVIPLGIWAARRFGPRLAQTSFGRALADDIAGRSLAHAQAELEALSRFEREE